MDSSDKPDMYIYDLPYSERKALCRILDVDDNWDELGGSYMNYDIVTLHHMRQAIIRNGSPTDELLRDWGTHNHTVLELFVLLSEMKHYQAMTVLMPYVSKKYHVLFNKGAGNLACNLVRPQEKIGKGFNDENFQNMRSDYDVKKVNRNTEKNMEPFIDYDKKIINKAPPYPEKEQAEGFSCKGSIPHIDYSELEDATDGWSRSRILGRGGFGTVFKGVWKNTQVAIKRLECRPQDADDKWKSERAQLMRELNYLNSSRHDNILPLYGYSSGGNHDCLIYQYMRNGSLEVKILCRDGSKPLSWMERYNIAVGIARGLQYLHTMGEKPLVHGDIKSANILLDPYLEPKIGDFGLAREGPLQEYTSIKVSRVHGTRPYLPDEFLRFRKFSTKVDTYSFGIVLFELVTGMRAYDDNRKNKFLKDHVLEVPDECIADLRDAKAGSDYSIYFPVLLLTGKACTQGKAKDRPEMVNVLEKLDFVMCTREVSQRANHPGRTLSTSPFNHVSQRRPTPPANPPLRLPSPPVPLPDSLSRVSSLSSDSSNPADSMAPTNPLLECPVINAQPLQFNEDQNIPDFDVLLGMTKSS